MQRLLLPFAVGFLAALAATMSFSVLSAGRAAAVQLQAADTTSTVVGDAEGELPSSASTADDASMMRAADNSVSSGGPARSGTSSSEAAPVSTRLTSDEGAAASLTIRRDSTGMVSERRLARTFGAMGAKDAARVMEQMSDADINTLLSHLNERQAAGILANISPARAARLGERTLRGSEGS